MVRLFKSVFTHWTRSLRWRLVGERYRPEQHYMRGPGPKTRAKAAERNNIAGS
ncbi:hypothetical protein X759_16570 [Mesorhizobium sp. LSHC420B00]|nr:hypothetical protein X759_16570 [Mesorhizobium sp. LSHC420B00]